MVATKSASHHVTDVLPKQLTETRVRDITKSSQSIGIPACRVIRSRRTLKLTLDGSTIEMCTEVMSTTHATAI